MTRCMSSPGASQVALVVKNLPAKSGDIRDAGSIPASGRSPGKGHGNPLQYSCLENPMDRGAWRALIHRVAKSQTRLKRLSTMPRPAPTEGTGEPWAPAHCFTADKLGTSGSYKSIFSFSGHMACGILVPWLGIEPRPSAVRAWHPNHWTTREFSVFAFLRGQKVYIILHDT